MTRSLYKLPKLLIIHLKRFKFGGYGGGLWRKEWLLRHERGGG